MKRMTASTMRRSGLALLAAAGLLTGPAASAESARQAAPDVSHNRVLPGLPDKKSDSVGTIAERPYRDGLMLAFGGVNRAEGVPGRRINPAPGLPPLVTGYRSLLKQRDPQARPDFAEFEGYIAGRRVGSRYTNLVMVSDRARITD